MTDTLHKTPLPEAVPEFPTEFPVGFATHPVGRLEQVWDFLPEEYRARVIELAQVMRDVRAELQALEQAVPPEAWDALKERRQQTRKRREEEAASLDLDAEEAKWEAAMRGIDANRAANGERLLFP